MSERLNFICLGDHMLKAHRHRACMEVLLSEVIGHSVIPIEMMRISGQTAMDNAVTWDESEKLAELVLEPGALLVAYFVVKGSDVDRHSLTIEARQGSTVLTLSIGSHLVHGGGPTASQMLGALAGWAMGAFDAAALACGPELDLYEIGNETSLRKIEERLSSDWRCWYSMSTRRFSKRIEVTNK